MIRSMTLRCLPAMLLIFALPQLVNAAPQATAKKDISFSQSIDVKWKKDKALVTFKQRRGKKTDTKKYTVSNMAELKDQNIAAYQLYLQSQGIDMSEVDSQPLGLELIPGTGRSSSSSIERRPSRYSEQPPTPKNSSFFGGGWMVSGMTNNNGNIRRYQDSGVFGNGMNGTGTTNGQPMNEQMKSQLRRMMEQTENPQIKQMLENMIQRNK